MRINSNIAALNTYRQLNTAQTNQSKSMEKLSSGLRINKAGDDAAGLAISEKMRGQIRGLEMGSKNAQDGISFIQTAEGALNETQSILQRMRELAVQSSNDTNTDSDRAELQKEVDQLSEEITRISNNTEFNTQTLLNGGIKDGNLGKVSFQIGANADQNISLDINAMDASSLGVSRNVTTGTLDSTNAGGVTSVKADSVDVSNVLAAGTYTVTVASVSAGATADFTGSGLSDSGTLISGTPTADFSSTITYNDAVAATAATVQGATLADTDTDFSTEAVNDVAIGLTIDGFNIGDVALDTVEGKDYTAAGTGGSGAENYTDLATDLATDINAAISAYNLANSTSIANVSVSSSNGRLSITSGSTGTTSEVTLAASDAGTSATGLLGLTGATDTGSAATAASFTVTGDGAGTFATNDTTTINGTAIDFGQIAGGGAGTDGDAFTITGNATAGTTVQLFDTAATPAAIGSAVTINQANGGTYTIGNTTTGQIEVNFAAGDATNGSTTVTVAQSASTGAALQADGTMSDAVSSGGINISSKTAANSAITTINTAIETVSAERSKLGAYQNRLEYTVNNLNTSSENLTAAESRIRALIWRKK